MLPKLREADIPADSALSAMRFMFFFVALILLSALRWLLLFSAYAILTMSSLTADAAILSPTSFHPLFRVVILNVGYQL